MRIRKAAEVQSCITALVTSNPTTTYAMHELSCKVLAQHPDVQDHHIMAAVKSLVRVKILQRIRAASGRSRFLYELHSSQKPKKTSSSEPEASDSAPYVAEAVIRSEPTITNVQVTIDKTTGGLQVEYRGIQLTIQIKE